MDAIKKQQTILQYLERYFEKNVNENNKGEFHLIDDILKFEKSSSEKYSVDDIITAIHADPDIKFSVRGFKVRPKPAELNSDPIIILSKKMAAILRHGLLNSGLEIRNGCYVRLRDLLNLPSFKGFNREDVLQVVGTNNKKRYEIIDLESEEFIGALQGHSVACDNSNLECLSISNDLKTAYHGTFYSNWESIKVNGLFKMGRNHIHMFSSKSNESRRDGAEIIIEIDVEKALKDGIRFFRSKNNVILCEGNHDVLTNDYFIRAWDVKTENILFSRPSNICKADSGTTPCANQKCQII